MLETFDIDLLKNKADNIIMKYMPEATGYASPVLRAMNYAVNAGGKRIRPLLMYLTYKAFGGESEVVEPFMAAIEMIHTYSLIHDDLPALDNDVLRRGKPTVHVKFGEDMAILAGDGLLNYAYETAAKAFAMKPGSVYVEKSYACLASKPGIYGMIGGQTADVYFTGKKLNNEELVYIYENKTAALIECSMMIGALLAKADEKEVSKIRTAAYNIGMAFQVQDDVLDIIADEKVLGKTVGSDEENNKYTYATIFGLDKAKSYVKEATEKAVSLLDEVMNLNQNEYYDLLKKLLLSLVNREK